MKRKMHKTKAEYEECLMSAFIAGCNHGYGVAHTNNIQEQERLGAEHYVGRISYEEFYERWDKLRYEADWR